MTKSELITKFMEEHISPRTYSFEKGKWGEEYVLANSKLNIWEVYYYERGEYNILATFISESEACAYFYDKVKKYSDSFER